MTLCVLGPAAIAGAIVGGNVDTQTGHSGGWVAFGVVGAGVFGLGIALAVIGDRYHAVFFNHGDPLPRTAERFVAPYVGPTGFGLHGSF
jgi:hypothetical protein